VFGYAQERNFQGLPLESLKKLQESLAASFCFLKSRLSCALKTRCVKTRYEKINFCYWKQKNDV